MPSLKSYRNRIASVKSTRKITSAMKMVAASKLKRAQDQAQASQPYARRMASLLGRVVSNLQINEGSPVLIAGTGKQNVHLLVVVTSDRGLCGGFNSFVVRKARETIQSLLSQGKEVKILCVGRKGRDQLRRLYGQNIVHFVEGIGRQRLSFADAAGVAEKVLEMLAAGQFDVCSVIYNEFRSVMTQVPVVRQLVPFSPAGEEEARQAEGKAKTTAAAAQQSLTQQSSAASAAAANALYEFEPGEAALLEELLPKNLSVQLFRALLDSAAGEQAARMTAMDNATRNAGDMIRKLTLEYNRARQAYITKELIEIISGAEAV